MESVCIPAMREVLKIARADGVDLPKDIINTVVRADDGIWFKPSMLVDVEKANLVGLEVTLDNLLAVGKELRAETPIMSLLYQLLRGVRTEGTVWQHYTFGEET